MRSSVPLASNLFLSAYCLAVVSPECYFVEDYSVAVTAVSGAAIEETKGNVIKHS